MKQNHLTAWGSLLACCLLAFLSGHSQDQPVQVRGSVKSVADGAPLSGVTVALNSDKNIATVTDASGNFLLKIPAAKAHGGIQLLLSSVGFQSKLVRFNPGQTDI